jgi:hypothetical protein
VTKDSSVVAGDALIEISINPQTAFLEGVLQKTYRRRESSTSEIPDKACSRREKVDHAVREESVSSCFPSACTILFFFVNVVLASSVPKNENQKEKLQRG